MNSNIRIHKVESQLDIMSFKPMVTFTASLSPETIQDMKVTIGQQETYTAVGKELLDNLERMLEHEALPRKGYQYEY